MSFSTRVCVVVAMVLAVAVVATANPLGPYKVDPSKVTVGGLSAGAFMAVQMHVAFSEDVHGAAVLAGGPFMCAQNQEIVATTTCMNPNVLYKPPNATDLALGTELDYKLGRIDNPTNLNAQPVYIYSGALDTVVHRPVVVSLVDYYNIFHAKVETEFDILSEHMYPTVAYGESCTSLGSPFIGKCNYDAAGAALSQLYGTLKPKGTSVSANLMSFPQTQFVANPAGISMGDTGYIYVPSACKDNSTECGLHITYHGCEQTLADIQEQYVQDVGLNEWAETNNIIVIYPQVKRSLPSNFEGCWDWWGYTDANYAYKNGKQMSVTMNMIKAVMGTL